jgi:predicted phosphoribosyltransferase
MCTIMGELIEDPNLRDKYYVFRNRRHAGELLAEKLKNLVTRHSFVLAIPSGGVPVGYEIAKRLNLPLDTIIVRKIPIPGETEAGFGALTFDGEAFLNLSLINRLGITEEEIETQKEIVRRQIERRQKIFRGGRAFPEISGKEVILVDDGLASGYTMLAALSSVKKRGPRRVIVAVPTAPRTAVDLILPEVDTLLCLNIRSGAVFAVADAYMEWYDLSEEEVVEYFRHPERNSG